MTDETEPDRSWEHPEGELLDEVPEPPRTGDEGVDAGLARLAGSAGEPLETQLQVFEEVHRTLQDRLADVEG